MSALSVVLFPVDAVGVYTTAPLAKARVRQLQVDDEGSGRCEGDPERIVVFVGQAVHGVGTATAERAR